MLDECHILSQSYAFFQLSHQNKDKRFSFDGARCSHQVVQQERFVYTSGSPSTLLSREGQPLTLKSLLWPYNYNLLSKLWEEYKFALDFAIVYTVKDEPK